MTENKQQGVIVKGIGGFYYILGKDQEIYTLRAKGAFRKQGITPLIGDRVTFTPGEGEEEGWIDEILERSNSLIRPPVSNISYLLIVIAPKPKPDLLLVDTLLIEARKQDIQPALILNKSDLNMPLCEQIAQEYANAAIPVLITSVKQNENLHELDVLIQQGICCFAGQSGVGKSSLVSAITGLSLTTGEISKKIARGKHTTRHAELLIHKEYKILDTAGFSLLTQAEIEDPVYLQQYYPEFKQYASSCRFQPCYHLSEPGCAVLQATQDGEISAERMNRYHQLLHNAQDAWKGRYE